MSEADTSSDPAGPTPTVSRVLEICNKRGLHARASAKFVMTVEQFDAEVFVTRGSERASARRTGKQRAGGLRATGREQRMSAGREGRGFPARHSWLDGLTEPSDWVTRRVLLMADEIRAEMVANVWKVVAAAGDTVAEGDTLVILESMKMEIPVVAESDGTVERLAVNEGDVVQEGDLIAVIQG